MSRVRNRARRHGRERDWSGISYHLLPGQVPSDRSKLELRLQCNFVRLLLLSASFLCKMVFNFISIKNDMTTNEAWLQKL